MKNILEYKGSFNVRMSPEMHRQAAYQAAKAGLTLNQYVSNAVAAQLANVR